VLRGIYLFSQNPARRKDKAMKILKEAFIPIITIFREASTFTNWLG
jgi:hypothetical protein